MRFNFLLLVTLFACLNAEAVQNATLKGFILKENLLKNDKIAVIATNESEIPVEVSGTYLFNINGFKQDLNFRDGVAVIPQPIEKSTLIFLKNIGDSSSVSNLYYILKRKDTIDPIKISLKLLVLIPVALIVLVGLFRKFLVYAIIILVGLVFFNFKNGLNIPTFFETLFEGLKTFF